MAFRSWNRGLAAAYQPAGGTTPFGVWLYNGTRWFPDPTFPGGSVCKGDTVLWAGKLDYWLVGQDPVSSGGENWPALCRFDGVNFEWERLPIPKATLAEVPLNAFGEMEPGGINAGACVSWDDCWFFGTYGVVVHWDGQNLSNASVGLGASPWLQADYTAAVERIDQAGNPFGFAVTASTSGASVTAGQTVGGQPVAAQPDGAAPPQLFGSFGGAFSPLGFLPPTSPQPGDPFRTDLVAVDFNSAGQGWVAGNPQGYRANGARFPATAQPAPLVRISTGGTALPCPGTPASEFSASATGDSYLWSSIGVFPGGDALAGGAALVPGSSGTSEPVLVLASCASNPEITRFRVPDPTAVDPASVPPVPADESGYISSVAVNAVNDAWAASSFGRVATIQEGVDQVPHLYHLTDTRSPLAPAGNDDETRPVTVTSEPVQYVVSPLVTVPAKPAPTKVTKIGKKRYKTVRLPSPIYAITSPPLHRASNGTLTLYIDFKVRTDVTIGVEAFRDSQVVSASGLHRFRAGTTGQLGLQLNIANWPTRLAFVLPKPKPKTKKT
jgi:hypothetical protein